MPFIGSPGTSPFPLPYMPAFRVPHCSRGMCSQLAKNADVRAVFAQITPLHQSWAAYSSCEHGSTLRCAQMASMGLEPCKIGTRERLSQSHVCKRVLYRARLGGHYLAEFIGDYMGHYGSWLHICNPLRIYANARRTAYLRSSGHLF